MEGPSGSFSSLYDAQRAFQSKVTGLDVPHDSVDWFTYHITAMQEEMGEVLKADKRWKTHRNHAYDPENKLEELADVFITAMNMAMFSGFTSDQLENAVFNKIAENNVKLEKAKRGV